MSGMTDKQFDSYKKLLLRRLERISKEADENTKDKELQHLIDDMREELTKP